MQVLCSANLSYLHCKVVILLDNSFLVLVQGFPLFVPARRGARLSEMLGTTIFSVRSLSETHESQGAAFLGSLRSDSLRRRSLRNAFHFRNPLYWTRNVVVRAGCTRWSASCLLKFCWSCARCLEQCRRFLVANSLALRLMIRSRHRHSHCLAHTGGDHENTVWLCVPTLHQRCGVSISD